MILKGIVSKVRSTVLFMAAFLAFSFQVQGQSSVVIYDTSNSGLVYNSIRDLAQEANGKLWIGTDWGLASFENGSWTSYQVGTSGLPDNDIRALALEGDSALWIGTFDGGLVRFNGSTWTVYNTSNSALPSDHIRALAMGTGDQLWIGTPGGLIRKTGSNWHIYDFIALGYESNNTASLWPIGFDTCYAGLVNGGLAYVADTSIVIQTLANSGLVDNTITAIAVDSQQDLWCGTPAGGLAYRLNQIWLSYNWLNSGNPAYTINSLVLDQEENLWMASLDKGLVFYDQNNWEYYDTSNSDIPEQNLRCMLLDSGNQTLWAGTSNSGLLEIKLNVLTRVSEPTASGFSILPNPNHGRFSILADPNWTKTEVKVFDLFGKLCFQGKISGREEKINVSLQPGIYLVELKKNGKRIVEKMLIR